jgi:hypothetical protein
MVPESAVVLSERFQILNLEVGSHGDPAGMAQMSRVSDEWAVSQRPMFGC